MKLDDIEADPSVNPAWLLSAGEAAEGVTKQFSYGAPPGTTVRLRAAFLPPENGKWEGIRRGPDAARSGRPQLRRPLQSASRFLPMCGHGAIGLATTLGQTAVVPEITGPAWLNGAVGFALDRSDPFPTGFGM